MPRSHRTPRHVSGRIHRAFDASHLSAVVGIAVWCAVDAMMDEEYFVLEVIHHPPKRGDACHPRDLVQA